ncbi:MAG: hypothetical protein H7Y18_20190 [Clostridiaceae bacterium]|nr:hypothetical protein [Clostridiaceae bacterium]
MFKKVISCFLVLLLSFSFVGCKNNSTKAVSKDKIISLGKNEGNVYSNDFFNMTIKIPDKWVVATDDEKKSLIEKGSEIVAGEDKTKAKQLDLAKLRTLYLLVISSKGTQVQSVDNPIFMAIAEKISFFQGVKNGAGYLAEVKKQLKALSSTLPYNLDKEVYTEKIGGKDFSVLEATISAGDIKMTQKYYACILNGYALSFITTSYDSEGAKSLDGVLKSITLK